VTLGVADGPGRRSNEKHGGFIFAMGIRQTCTYDEPPGVDRMIRVGHRQTEIVEHVSQLKHELAGEALRLHGIEDRFEITSWRTCPPAPAWAVEARI